MELITGDNDNGRRLDRILRKAMPDHSLALIHRLLRQGKIFVNGEPAKAQDRLVAGVKITIPSLKDTLKQAACGFNQKIRLSQNTISPLQIIWEGSGLLAVNKPPGIAVHGRDSLDTAVRSFLADKLPPSLSFKPGPLHRLDKPSSGIIVFSANIEGARLFTYLIRERKVRKIYLTIVEGTVKNEEIWQDTLIRDKEKKKTYRCLAPLGKTAITKVFPLAANGKYSLIQAEIVTGITHQIRAQAAAHGYPLTGDVKYKTRETSLHNANDSIADFFLHAWKLEFLEYSIEAPIPKSFREKIKELFGELNYISLDKITASKTET